MTEPYYQHEPSGFDGDDRTFRLDHGAIILYQDNLAKKEPVKIGVVDHDRIHNSKTGARCLHLAPVLKTSAISPAGVFVPGKSSLCILPPNGEITNLAAVIGKQYRRHAADAMVWAASYIAPFLNGNYEMMAAQREEDGRPLFSLAAQREMKEQKIESRIARRCLENGDVIHEGRLPDETLFVVHAFNAADIDLLRPRYPAAHNIRVVSSASGQIVWAGYNTDRIRNGSLPRIVRALSANGPTG